MEKRKFQHLKQQPLDSLLLGYLGDAHSIDLWKIIVKEWLTQKRQEEHGAYEKAKDGSNLIYRETREYLLDELLRELK